MENITSQGILPRLRALIWGDRAARLTESLTKTHWLSYLLIVSQSIAVVLVLGHAELPLLLTGSWAIRALASMVFFVLIATVFASDLALLETLRRIPVLKRNRQRWQHREHMLYVSFVLLVEASTYALTLAVLDRDPQALFSAKPLIPTSGPIFWSQVILRAALICWTAIQLVVIRQRLPVLLSTLTSTGKEIVGAKVEQQLAELDIAGVTLPDTFRTYAAMARPPRRIPTWWNGWLVRREIAAEAEEQRQVDNVVDALEDLERRRVRAASQPGAPAVRTDEQDNTRPPTGGGSPSLARGYTRSSRTAPHVVTLAPLERDSSVAAEAALHQAAPRSHSAPVRTALKSSGKTTRKGSRKSSTVTATQRRQDAAQKRADRLAQLEVLLAEDPSAGVRELTRRLAAAEGVRISESTVTALLRELEARQGMNSFNPATSGAYAQ